METKDKNTHKNKPDHKSMSSEVTERSKIIVPLVNVIQIMVAAFPEEVMDRSRKVS